MCSHAPDKIFHYNGSINPGCFLFYLTSVLFQFFQRKIIVIVVYWSLFFAAVFCWKLLQDFPELSRIHIIFSLKKTLTRDFLFQLRSLLVFYFLSNSEFLIKIQKLIKICLQSICRTSFSCSHKFPWKLESALSISVTFFIGELHCFVLFQSALNLVRRSTRDTIERRSVSTQFESRRTH